VYAFGVILLGSGKNSSLPPLSSHSLGLTVKSISNWLITAGVFLLLAAIGWPAIQKIQFANIAATYKSDANELYAIWLNLTLFFLVAMAVAGCLLIVAGVLILKHIKFGWLLQLFVSALCLLDCVLNIQAGGLINLVCLGVFGGLLYASLRLRKHDEFKTWWRNHAQQP